MATLHLVRHGQTTANVMRRLDTALPGASLTDFGARQAVRYALDRPVTRSPVLITSTARRARETAELIGSVWGVTPQVIDGLFEVQIGDLEGRTDDEAHAAMRAMLRRWHDGELDAALTGGESLADIFGRYLPVLDDIAARHLSDPDGPDVHVVSHGAAIRLAAGRLAGLDPHFASSVHLANTGTVELERVDGVWVCRRWGAGEPPAGPTAPAGRADAERVSDPMG